MADRAGSGSIRRRSSIVAILATAALLSLLGISSASASSRELAGVWSGNLQGALHPDSIAAGVVRQIWSPWMRFFVAYDPAPALRKLRVPVLALNGSKDQQVPPAENLAAIRNALEAGGNRDFETRELPLLNHLFQTSDTGGVYEYARIEETLAPAALDEITRWILAHVRYGR